MRYACPCKMLLLQCSGFLITNLSQKHPSPSLYCILVSRYGSAPSFSVSPFMLSGKKSNC